MYVAHTDILSIDTSSNPPYQLNDSSIHQPRIKQEVTMGAAHCPLCIYSVPSICEKDSYSLQQYFQLSHSRNEMSPFRDLEENSSPRTSMCLRHLNLQEISLSGDDDDREHYVKCPVDCGEIVSSTEPSYHLELHCADGVAEECEDEGNSPCLEAEITPQNIDSAIPGDHIAPITITEPQDSNGRNGVIFFEMHQSLRRNKDQHGTHDWKTRFLGVPFQRPRKPILKVNNAAPHRLGVSKVIETCILSRLRFSLSIFRNLSLDHMHTRNKCQHGFSSN